MMILLGALSTVSACATVPPPGSALGQAEYEENDPIEPLNRAIFAFNRALDDAVLKPLARVYRDILPIWARARVDNALDNTSLQKAELVALILRDGPSDLLRMRIFFEIQCNNLILRSGVAASRRIKQ